MCAVGWRELASRSPLHGGTEARHARGRNGNVNVCVCVVQGLTEPSPRRYVSKRHFLPLTPMFCLQGFDAASTGAGGNAGVWAVPAVVAFAGAAALQVVKGK